MEEDIYEKEDNQEAKNGEDPRRGHKYKVAAEYRILMKKKQMLGFLLQGVTEEALPPTYMIVTRPDHST